jgi:hypothetical protein
VLLRLYQVYNAGTERQTEKELRNYEFVTLPFFSQNASVEALMVVLLAQ